MDKENTQIEKNEQEIVTIPVKIRNKLLVANAVVNGENKPFIIDNGAPILILNSKHFKNLHEDKMVISNGQGVNTSISNMDITQIEEFDFYGIKMKENEVVTVDISHLEQKLKSDIYGLIGYEVYKDYDVLFDYAKKTVTLIQPNVTKNYLKNHYKQDKIEEIPIEMYGHIPTVKVKIGETEFCFGIDCGANGNLLDKKFYMQMKKHVSRLKNVDLTGADETRNTEVGKIKNLSIGKKTFRNTITVFNDMSHLNTAYNMQLDGLFGYEILSKQKVLLSFKNKKMYLID